MDAHFFTFQQCVKDEPQRIWKDYIVRGNHSFAEAKDIALKQVAADYEGMWALYAIYAHDEELITAIRARKKVEEPLAREFEFREAY